MSPVVPEFERYITEQYTPTHEAIFIYSDRKHLIVYNTNHWNYTSDKLVISENQQQN